MDGTLLSAITKLEFNSDCGGEILRRFLYTITAWLIMRSTTLNNTINIFLLFCILCLRNENFRVYENHKVFRCLYSQTYHLLHPRPTRSCCSKRGSKYGWLLSDHRVCHQLHSRGCTDYGRRRRIGWRNRSRRLYVCVVFCGR